MTKSTKEQRSYPEEVDWTKHYVSFFYNSFDSGNHFLIVHFGEQAINLSPGHKPLNSTVRYCPPEIDDLHLAKMVVIERAAKELLEAYNCVNVRFGLSVRKSSCVRYSEEVYMTFSSYQDLFRAIEMTVFEYQTEVDFREVGITIS